jgi:hypothetical protein
MGALTLTGFGYPAHLPTPCHEVVVRPSLGGHSQMNHLWDLLPGKLNLIFEEDGDGLWK